MTINMKSLMNKLYEDRFDTEVEEQKNQCIIKLAYIIAAEVNETLKANNVAPWSMLANKTINEHIKIYSNDLKDQVTDIILEDE